MTKIPPRARPQLQRSAYDWSDTLRGSQIRLPDEEPRQDRDGRRFAPRPVVSSNRESL